MTSWLTRQDDLARASAAIRRFGTLIEATPSLRAHQSDMMDQSVAVAAEILAGRAWISPDDPEPQIAATALLGLWRIQFQALSKYLDGTRTPAQVHQAVSAEVNRAAQVIDHGLRSFDVGKAAVNQDHRGRIQSFAHVRLPFPSRPVDIANEVGVSRQRPSDLLKPAPAMITHDVALWRH